MCKKTYILLLFVFISDGTLLLAQEDEIILPGQSQAISDLAGKQGFNIESLNQYLQQEMSKTLLYLSRKEASYIIRLFQSNNPPTPKDIIRVQTSTLPSIHSINLTPERVKPTVMVDTPPPGKAPIQKKAFKPKIAEVLEVGMAKRFHLIDGNIIKGEIIKIEGSLCHIQTAEGLLHIPKTNVLEETATITKKDDTKYIGPVLRESSEEIVLRSRYGDVVINKRDVKEMNRFHGGKLIPWIEEKKTFFRGEVVLTDIFMDPTAFPLSPNTFYLSGLTLGYGFTEKFMIRSKFANDLSGDLNIMPHFRFYHMQTGSSRRAAAIGGHLFNNHPMNTLVAKYAREVLVSDNKDENLNGIDSLSVNDVLIKGKEQKDFYWELYTVFSSKRSMPNNRGEIGWHVGVKTNALALKKPDLKDGYEWNKFIPYRLWGAFEYDLSKNLKLAGIMWMDNGHKFRNFGQSMKDYTDNFILDSKSGEYRGVDFDFGFLYAVSETFRIGIHFQEPFLVFYWKFFEL